MWINPKYAQEREPERPRESPVEQGKCIAAMKRLAGNPGQTDKQLRVTICEFNGHPYIGLRVWFQRDDNQWFPSKQGCTIRVGEIDDMIAALQKARARLAPSE
jgi:hypothetical protein